MTAMLAELQTVTRARPKPALPVAAGSSDRGRLWARALGEAETVILFGDAADAPIAARLEAESVSDVSRLLGADRSGAIGAIFYAAGDADEATVAETLKNLRAVAAHAFHDAEILLDWKGADDAPCVGLADRAVVARSDWRWAEASGLVAVARG